MPDSQIPQDLISVETRGGEPVTAPSGYTLTPFSRSVSIHLPGFPGGLVWNRPVSVLVQDPTGNEQILRVHDLTRIVQISLLGGTLLAVLIVGLTKRISR